MTIPFDITITLTKEEAASALAQYIATKMGSGYSVQPASVDFEVKEVFEDRPCGGSSVEFSQVTARAIKVTSNTTYPGPG